MVPFADRMVQMPWSAGSLRRVQASTLRNRTGVRAVDLRRQLASRLDFLSDGVHYSPQGHVAIALALELAVRTALARRDLAAALPGSAEGDRVGSRDAATDRRSGSALR